MAESLRPRIQQEAAGLLRHGLPAPGARSREETHSFQSWLAASASYLSLLHVSFFAWELQLSGSVGSLGSFNLLDNRLLDFEETMSRVEPIVLAYFRLVRRYLPHKAYAHLKQNPNMFREERERESCMQI